MERSRAMRHRERVTRADVRRELLLEALRLRPGRDPSGAQGVEHLALLVRTDRWAMERNLAHQRVEVDLPYSTGSAGTTCAGGKPEDAALPAAGRESLSLPL